MAKATDADGSKVV